MLFQILTHRALFPGRNFQELYKNNKFLNPQAIVEAQCQCLSLECRDLLKKMLDSNPDTRPTAEECLNHDWFKCNRDVLQKFILLNKESSICNSSKNSSHSPCHRNLFHKFDDMSFLIADKIRKQAGNIVDFNDHLRS